MTIGGRLRLFPFRRNLRPQLARGGTSNAIVVPAAQAQRYVGQGQWIRHWVWSGLTGMLIGMLFRSMLVVLGSVKRMAVRDLGMVGCFFMMPGLRMFGGLSVVSGGMFVMFSGFFVVFVNCVLFHD